MSVARSLLLPDSCMARSPLMMTQSVNSRASDMLAT